MARRSYQDVHLGQGRLHLLLHAAAHPLGLAVSNAFIVAHGGRIWAESNSGQGARFHFTLPLRGGIG
ncbi:MAG: hypothetical protein HY683_04955 [Chloroflexi bacterium]|nr:hypothetical protein [Chloroflexota bacterium]